MLSLVFVMVTSMLLALVLAALAQQVAKTKNDRSFTSALPSADAGIQQAIYYLRTGQTLPTSTSPATGTTTQASGPTSYKWYATPVVATGSPTYYVVTSTTTVNNVQRTVSAEVYQNKRFAYALFADASVNFNGANNALSYIITGFGNVATNGTVNINGASSGADTCTIFGQGTSGPNLPNCTTTVYMPTRNDITSPAAEQFLTTALSGAAGTACAGQLPLVAYAGQTLLAGRTYCFSSLAFTGSESILGTSSAPTKIFVSGNISIPNHQTVHASSNTPDSGGLQIYSTGTAVTAGNHSVIGAAIWAPNALCSGGAQASVYGSLVCGSIGNVGGWTFNYDTNLSAVGDDNWQMRHYAESTGN